MIEIVLCRVGRGKDETIGVLDGWAGKVWELEGEDCRDLEGIVLEWMKGASLDDEEPLR